MESSNRTFLPLSRFSYLHDVESRGKSEGLNHHQHCSSESYLIEEQPLWLDDLLNDPDTDFLRGHWRAASDSYAYLGEAAATFAKGDESKFVNAYFGMTARSQNLANQDETSGNSVAQKTNQGIEEGLSSLSVENNREESRTQNSEGSSDKAVGSQVKNSATKTESKRSNKQHNAHRSRVRKLQYIAHLERSLEILKAEGAEVSAEIEFVEQQNIILMMENRALKQRLESLSQEQIIKHWEQEMLAREIGRLQSGYHLQKQQMQMHYQQQQQQLHNQHAKQRRNRCREIDQVNNATMKNKDAICIKDSVNGSIQA